VDTEGQPAMDHDGLFDSDFLVNIAHIQKNTIRIGVGLLMAPSIVHPAKEVDRTLSVRNWPRLTAN
jgi:hypothetical protein